MSTSFIVSTDDGYVTQLGNLSAKLPTVQATLGLLAADAAAVSADYAAMQAAVLDGAAKKTAAQSATRTKAITRAASEKRLRALVKRIRGSANYTPAIGELLGIVAPAASTGKTAAALASESMVQPQLKGSVSGNGVVSVKFAKKSYSGVLIYSRCGDGKEFTLLSKQLVSPLADARANASDGVPETREYRGQFFRNDTPVGQMSDILRVTVPAGGAGGTGAVGMEIAGADVAPAALARAA